MFPESVSGFYRNTHKPLVDMNQIDGGRFFPYLYHHLYHHLYHQILAEVLTCSQLSAKKLKSGPYLASNFV